MAVILPAGYRLRQFEELGSTNSFALEAGRNGEPGGFWIVAKRQTGGRGSRGRKWIGLDGNLFCSLLLVDPAETGRHPELTFVAALAVRDTVLEMAAEGGLAPEITLKWPNDVLLNGAKVSGILLESHRCGDRQCVIVGIGINCAAHPQDMPWPAVDLRSAGLAVTPNAVFEKLADLFDRRLSEWDGGRNFTSIRKGWLEAAMGRGERIVVKLPNARYEGIFENIDLHGRLLLRTAGGQILTLSAAEIFFSEALVADSGS